MKTFVKISALAVATLAFAAGFSGQAYAVYSCTDSTYGVGTGTYDSCSTNNTANQASTVATAATVLRSATTQTAGLVTDRIAVALGGNSGSFDVSSNGFSASTGLSGGDHSGKAGLWVNGAWTGSEDENSDTAFEGDTYTGMVGADYQVTSRTVIGVAVGYEDTQLETAYNGFGINEGSLNGDGYTVAPYIGVKLSDNASVDLTAGYSDIDYETVRFDPNTGNRITGSTDGERYFVNAALSGSHQFNGNWRLRSRGSVFYASEEKDAFTETEAATAATIAVGEETTDLGQVMLDERLGYRFQHAEPYALVGLEYDYAKDDAPVATTQTVSDSDFGAKFGAGLDFDLGPNFTGGFEAYTVEFREDYEEYTVTGGLRAQF